MGLVDRLQFQAIKIGADRGEAYSQCALGLHYYVGNCVEQNNDKAAYWLEKAAQQGIEKAMLPLGMIYQEQNDLKKAEKWFGIANENGVPGADKALEIVEIMIGLKEAGLM